WRWYRWRKARVRAASPNPAHHAIAALERRVADFTLATQNVDGLHAAAGVPDDHLLEIHGSARFAKCLSCRRRFARDDSVALPIDLDAGVPRCPSCGGLLKSGGVSFGEPLPERELQRATAHARHADLFVVVGSSLTVFPAANLPRLARDHGARLVIINLGPTKLDALADLRVDAKAGEFLPPVARAALALREPPW
ncbi:MAG: hypothetical protein NZ518_08860, partial [Dehalococcoidia bacterium]|nr:hypothetical protein [Dehalococcoidia bacterium]